MVSCVLMQVIEFPSFSSDVRAALAALGRACGEVPAEGEPFAAWRTRLRAAKLWDRERPVPLLRLLGLGAGRVAPTPQMLALASAPDDAARSAALGGALWTANPLLAKTIFELVAERAYHKDEIYKYLGSTAYRGEVPSRPALEAYFTLAFAAGWLKAVGIAVAAGPQAEAMAAQVKDFDVDEFLETSAPLPPLDLSKVSEGEVAAAPPPFAPAVSPGAAAQLAVVGGAARDHAAQRDGAMPADAKVSLPAPLRHLLPEPLPFAHDKATAISTAQFRNGFTSDVRGQTAARVAQWWGATGAAGTRHPGFTPADFGWDAEAWVETGDELLYQMAVAAALVFRLPKEPAEIVVAYAQLRDAGVLGDLYEGAVPEGLPHEIDANALLLAGLAARRVVEHPTLAADLSAETDAHGALRLLDKALGRGFLRLELFWLLDMLRQLGVVRFVELAAVTTVPYRVVRDVLFRLGFIDSPYAATLDELAQAAAAASQAVGTEVQAPSEVVLTAFASAVGCGYDCTQRRVCGLACRERLDA